LYFIGEETRLITSVVQYLFNINAGSDTVSMFVIDPLDPLHPRLVGEPASSLGHIPVSVTYSPELNIGTAVTDFSCGPILT